MILNQGDTIGIIALSGDCEKEKIQKAKNYFETLGYKVRLSKNIYDKNRYLAGNDYDKIEELSKFFADKEVKLILSARGGYGAIRLVNKIDYDIIKNNPKPICGFSDFTALLLMIYKKTGIITYHSPMASSDFANEDSIFSKENFFSALEGKNLEFKGEKIYNSGKVEGIIWGGNLSTVVSLCGLDFIPNKDFIFFAEDLNEPVYKIDKMFQQLFNIEKFQQNCKGLVLGEFINTDNEKWLDEYFMEFAKTYNMPVSGGFKITHGKDKITIPIGKNAELENNTLRI